MSELRTILVAGATGSIGGAAGLALARRGVHVVLLGRSADRLAAKAAAIRSKLGGEGAPIDANVDALCVDFSDLQSVRDAVEEVSRRWPAVHGLVLSVGAYAQNGPTIR